MDEEWESFDDWFTLLQHIIIQKLFYNQMTMCIHNEDPCCFVVGTLCCVQCTQKYIWNTPNKYLKNVCSLYVGINIKCALRIPYMEDIFWVVCANANWTELNECLMERMNETSIRLGSVRKGKKSWCII